MDRRVFLKSAFFAGAAATMTGGAAVAGEVCGRDVAQFHQISISTSDLPFVFTHAYRLNAAGHLQYAKWSNQHRLSSVADPVAVAADTAAAFRDIVGRRLRSGLRLFSRGPDRADRPATGIELGAYVAGKTIYASKNDIPKDVADFLAGLDRQLAATAPRPGAYVWTKPVARSVVDIDLRGGDCGSDIGNAISESLRTANLLMRVETGFEAYLSGDLANRNEFGARFDTGFAAYGVVQA